jgi:hypothetical protein
MSVTILIENRAGAHVNIGIDDVAHGLVDGYTLVMPYVGTCGIEVSIY